jgi:hypothetical protein
MSYAIAAYAAAAVIWLVYLGSLRARARAVEQRRSVTNR